MGETLETINSTWLSLVKHWHSIKRIFHFFVTIFLYLLFPVFVNLPGILNIESSCLLISFHFSITSANGLLILDQDCWVEYSFPPHQSLHLFYHMPFQIYYKQYYVYLWWHIHSMAARRYICSFFSPNGWILKNGYKKQNDVFGPIRRCHF